VAFISLDCSSRCVPLAMRACIGWLRSGAGWNPHSFPSGGNSTVMFRCNCSFLGIRPRELAYSDDLTIGTADLRCNNTFDSGCALCTDLIRTAHSIAAI
jgi:hypothetical protein